MEIKIELVLSQENIKSIAEGIAPILFDLISKQIKEAATPDNILTIKQVSSKVNRSEQTIRRWLKEKKLISCDVGGLYGVRESELQRFLDRHNK